MNPARDNAFTPRPRIDDATLRNLAGQLIAIVFSLALGAAALLGGI